MSAASAPRLASRPIERRRHRRVPVALLGRYMLPSRMEFPCQTADISPGGVAVVAPVKAKNGEKVIIYLEHLGRIEGTVTRVTAEGFCLSIAATMRKREKFAAQLTWLANRHVLGLPEDRRHERVTPRNPRSIVTMEDGTEVVVRLLDVSLSGAAFSADRPLPIGIPIKLGKTNAKLVRKFEGGYAAEFRHPISADRLDENIDL